MTDNKIIVEIKNNLKEILRQRGITGYKLSQDTGIVSQSIYNKVLKEDYVPSLKTAYKIANYLQLDIEDIWTADINVD